MRGRFGALVLAAVCGACGGGGGGGGPDGEDAGATDSGSVDASMMMDAPGSDAGPAVCRSDTECQDGSYCNGVETCAPSEPLADARGCVPAAAVDCDDGIACTLDSCSDESESCRHTPPDTDGDGHGDAACTDAGGGALGDDCDDADALAYPGNMEVCDGHDEDCNPDTLGFLDADGDGSSSNACCNGPTCGPDCNDSDSSVRPGIADGPPSSCDTIDNDCDGSADEGCPCVEGLSRECGTDVERMRIGECRPGTQFCVGAVWTETCTGAVHPDEEICDTRDNDCDGMSDEGVERSYYPDLDGDGFGAVGSTPVRECSAPSGYAPVPTDCDDAAPGVNPSAPEVCNGIDDNCAMGADEGGLRATYYRDADGDGYGAAATSVMACVPPAGHVGMAGDCDDARPAVHPGVADVCNGVDDDCDGSSDPMCACTDGATRPCGPMVDTGECAFGTQRCIGGAWAECVGAVLPASEVCNARDDDCDGTSDEMVQLLFYRDADRDGFGDSTGTTMACSQPVGHVANSDDCDDTDNAVSPAAFERCDGTRDDDCDGTTDEGCTCRDGATQTCGSSATGVCRRGTQQCVGGVWTSCVGNVEPAMESCNTLDDDCDGTTDEMLTIVCYVDADSDGFGTGAPVPRCPDMGRCPAGYAAAAGDCNDSNGSVRPTGTEVCNGTDDDCDGMTDEGATRAFYRDADGDGFGAGMASMACTAPSGFVSTSTDCNDADASVSPVAAERCDGAMADDDCDGSRNEGCSCVDGATAPCGSSSVGVCRMGVQRCIAGTWSTCSGNVEPGMESCNTLDDDCDGTTDEMLTITCYLDADSDGFGTGAAVARCPDMARCPAGYAPAAGDCNDSNGSIRPMATEACNGTDDDCDGMADEGATRAFYRDADGDGFGTGTATMACSAPAGFVSTSTDCNDADASVSPVATERCDAAMVDDDCDGTRNEGCMCTDGATRACGSSSVGVCRMGVQLCTAGTWGTCSGNVEPGAETCNGLDDDCDGMADETTTVTCYADSDSDGFGAGAAVARCPDPSRTMFGNCPAGYDNDATDCADSSSAVRPGATETCNGVDDNCIGGVDEGVTSTFFRDADRDGYGVAGMTMMGCSAPGGYVANSLDCNDAVDTVHPGAPEICDGVDQNCAAGTTDEPRRTFYRDADGDLYGVAGMTMSACSPPAGHAEVTGDCNDANGAIHPGAFERCDMAMADDDCDGTANEMCVCTDGSTMMCGTSSTGTCRRGLQQCVSGTWGSCVGNVEPVAETCDALDNDCDGTPDDDGSGGSLRITCYQDGDDDTYGVGSASTQCPASGRAAWGNCPLGFTFRTGDCNDGIPGVRPGVAETCNGVDDNCSGAVDEGVTITCSMDGDNDTYGTGATSARCPDPARAAWGGCPVGFAAMAGDCNDGVAAIRPGAAETCNAGDDDCDTMRDETFACIQNSTGNACTTSCSTAGTRECTSMCTFTGMPCRAPEVCNGCDDDADGIVDDGFACAPGTSRACSTACATIGSQTCSAGCAWGPCTATESCNNCDDDGDGATDETFTCAQGTLGPACATACGTGGTQRCRADCGGYDACRAATDACNGCDDDLDGAPDDGHTCPRGQIRSCTHATCGTPGTQVCNAGCTAYSACAAPAETCNYCDDNNVAGVADEVSLATQNTVDLFEACGDILSPGSASCNTAASPDQAIIVNATLETGGIELSGGVRMGYGLFQVHATVAVRRNTSVNPADGWAVVIYTDAGALDLGAGGGNLGVNHCRDGYALEWRFYTGGTATQPDEVRVRAVDGDCAGNAALGPVGGGTPDLDSSTVGFIAQGVSIDLTPDDPATPADETGVRWNIAGGGSFIACGGSFGVCPITLTPGTIVRVGIVAATGALDADVYVDAGSWGPVLFLEGGLFTRANGTCF